MGREQLRQIDRMAGEDTKHAEAEDRQHDRVEAVVLKSEIQVQPACDRADVVQHNGRAATDCVRNEAERGVAQDSAQPPQRHAMADERHGGAAGDAAARQDLALDGRQPDLAGPDRQQRAQAEQHPYHRAVAVLRTE